jgi:hypothetical protein
MAISAQSKQSGTQSGPVQALPEAGAQSGPLPRKPERAGLLEYRFTVRGASREIALSRSHVFRAHGAEIVRGPVFESGSWRIYMTQSIKS